MIGGCPPTGADKPGTTGLEWWQLWLVRVKSNNSRERAGWETMGSTASWLQRPIPLLTASEPALRGDSLPRGPAGPRGPQGPTWIQPSGPWKVPRPPAWMETVSRSVLTVFQASGLIKIPKGSNPWMPLKGLQLLPFMKEAWQDIGGGGGEKGEGVSRKDGEREEFRQGQVIQTEPPSKRVMFYQLKLSCLPSQRYFPPPPQLSLTLL